MEDLLALYTQPEDPKRPLVCMDEVPKQLVSDVREPIPAQPGQPERVDYAYQRNGVANLFMFFEPFGLPFGFPDWPGWNCLCFGGFL